jgi:hypothetical protein
MSGQPATSTAAPRVLLVDDGVVCDVFEVIDATDGVVRVRAPFLFEIGEELKLRIERDGAVTEATARVRAHVGNGDERTSELELVEQKPA